MGLFGVSKSTVLKLCKDTNARVGIFLNRPLSAGGPISGWTPPNLRQREGSLTVSAAAIIAVACDSEGGGNTSLCHPQLHRLYAL